MDYKYKFLALIAIALRLIYVFSWRIYAVRGTESEIAIFFQVNLQRADPFPLYWVAQLGNPELNKRSKYFVIRCPSNNFNGSFLNRELSSQNTL